MCVKPLFTYVVLEGKNRILENIYISIVGSNCNVQFIVVAHLKGIV